MRKLAILFVLFALGGCVVFPVPGPAYEPRFTAEQISALVPGTTTRETVTQQLGLPGNRWDFERLAGRHWVYTWRERGPVDSLGLIVFPPIGGDLVTFGSQLGLFLRFDERGLLQHRELVEWRTTKTIDATMCDAEAICIEHPGEGGFFVDRGSAFTAPGDLRSTHPAPDQCSLVLWLDKEDWTTPSEHAASWLSSMYEHPPGGISFDYSPKEDAASHSLTSWLPVGAYVSIKMQPGEREILLRNPWVGLERATQSVPFHCVAGATTFVLMGARSKKFGEEFGVIWREVPHETALIQLQGMRQVLLREFWMRD